MTLHSPSLVTLTGVDASVDLDHLIGLVRQPKLPPIEIGLLYSPGRSGQEPRYSSADWLSAARRALARAGVRTALHLCGDAVPNLVEGGITETALANGFGRIQLNVNLARHPHLKGRIMGAAHPERPFILQVNENNQFAPGEAPPGLHLLVDGSGGRGLTPRGWQSTITGAFTGFAGGLGAATIDKQLPKIAAAAQGRPYWIDCENALRDERDFFCLERTEKYLTALRGALFDADDRGPRRRVWPVIHYLNQATALTNARLALSAGCRGVMVINMVGPSEPAFACAQVIRRAYPGLRVGVNALDMPLPQAMVAAHELGLDAVWSDDAGYRAGAAPLNVDSIHQARRQCPGLEIFAGVAFKYRTADSNPGASAHAMWADGLIPCTSGPGTGVAPDIGKLQGIRRCLPVDGRLGVASGVTPDNVSEIGRTVTDILVATGVSDDEHELSGAKLRALMMGVERINRGAVSA